MNNKNNFLLPASITSAAIIICAIILAATWKSNYRSNQTINITGSAEREITSDLGVLRGTISSQEPTADAAYRELSRMKPILISYLSSKGFPEDKIDFYTINSYPVYQIGAGGYQTGVIIAYNYSQRIEIESNDVNKIKEISLDIPSLIEKGVNFNVEQPEYHYTKLAALKIDIQADAAKDAMIRAEKIAKSTGRSLGSIRDARMGVIQITPKLSNQVSDYGINDLSSIDKKITAVVNASFEIE
ncbi:MAG TPA: SIMPL domain-containing protein [Ignavibacteriaceae bacterium]|nr:SIMPL domain-containing protein [Ignavibacteriaceae bacterium]